VQRAEHFRHLAIGAGLVGDGEQRALQSFGLFRRLTEPRRSSMSVQAAQMRFDQVCGRVELLPAARLGPALGGNPAREHRDDAVLAA
jgi:hypothetical protein